jgi:hypothetical protein
LFVTFYAGRSFDHAEGRLASRQCRVCTFLILLCCFGCLPLVMLINVHVIISHCASQRQDRSSNRAGL